MYLTQYAPTNKYTNIQMAVYSERAALQKNKSSNDALALKAICMGLHNIQTNKYTNIQMATQNEQLDRKTNLATMHSH
jgi:hypothetical protein